MKTTFSAPVRLELSHKPLLNDFSCGNRAMDDWLKHRALQNEIRGGSRTYLVFSSTGEIAAYYCLSAHSISHDDLRAKAKRNTPSPIPAIHLGRLAVALKYQKQGLGKSLLKHAIDKTRFYAEEIGIAVLIAHPISENVVQFFKQNGFSELQKDNPPLLYLDLKRP